MISTTLMNLFVLTALVSIFISSTTSFIVPHTTRGLSSRAVARAVVRSNGPMLRPLLRPLQPLAASDTSNADVDVETLESVLMKVRIAKQSDKSDETR